MEGEGVPAEEYKTIVWDLIDSYFRENRGLQSQAIASFNLFVKETLPRIVVRCGHVEVDGARGNNAHREVHSVEFTAAYLEKKIIQHSADGRIFPLYPHEARSRNLTYSSALSVDIRHTIKDVDGAGYETLVKEVIHPKVCIGDIPIMVKSEFCRLHGLSDRELASFYEDPNDPGGYFIINGKEKVIVTQERPANNKLFLFKPMCDSKYQYECEIRSSADPTIDKVAALWIHIPGNPKSFNTFKDSKRFKVSSSSSSSRAKKKSLQSDAMKKKMTKQYLKNRPGLVVTIAMVRGTIPLVILFKAMGFETDGEIWETFLADADDLDFYEALRTTMENVTAREIKTEQDAQHYIGSKSLKEAASDAELIYQGRKVINEEVLPALGAEPMCDRLKGYHVGYMVNRLVFAYLGRIHCDDRDHLQNKRFDLAGSMLAGLFKNQIKNLMNESRIAIARRLDRNLDYDIQKNILRQKLVTRGINYAMTSGNWGDKRRGSSGRVGVSQLLNRLTPMATLSYLRRINSPTNRLVRMTAPRQVHTTAFGYICPADTPEGETVGLLKALSVMAEISTESETGPIVEVLEELGYASIEDSPEKLAKDIKILINFEIMGTCPRERAPLIVNALKKSRKEFDEAKETKKKLQRLKNPEYKGTYRGIPNQVSIVYDAEYREIRIRTDPGRAFRPLLSVENNELALRRKHIRRLLKPKSSYGWKNLIKAGVIEFIDAAESETAMIAMFPGDLDGSSGRHMTYLSKYKSQPLAYKVTYTHCEIHPSMILGVCASLIPYPDHNQSPRNSYQSGMCKQAIGVYQTNFYYRNDPESHILHYPQRPLVTTRTAKFINYDDNPAGVNTICAIACYSGYNQEDSIILNKSAVQRGLFRSTIYRVKQEEARVFRGRGDMDETFELPRKGEIAVFRNPCYVDLDRDGLPAAGIEVKDGDPLIGKTQCINAEKIKQMEGIGRQCSTKTDISVSFRSSAASAVSYIDSVILTNNHEGYRMVKVKIRTPRNPQIGDKFASRHGQKGVVGMDFDETELPFTKDGIVPDVILNPHAIPSRMTIGHLLETVSSKTSALEGVIYDGTCFTEKLTVDQMGDQLEQLGFQRHGTEVLYNGATGRKLMSQIFIGPVFYQRLKHMTEDKLHIRSRGPVTDLCKQPSAGMQREGGLRFGEMERDSTITHGAASFLRERLFIVSDYYSVPVCTECGNFLRKKPAMCNRDYVVHLKCRFCKRTSVGAATVELPFACKLFFQELMSMNIRVMMQPESTARDIQPTPESLKPPKFPNNNIVSALIRKMNVERLRDDF